MSPNIGVHCILLAISSVFLPFAMTDCQFNIAVIDQQERDMYNFYFVHKSAAVQDVQACALFCFVRKFCRTSVFKKADGTCSLSYGLKSNCRLANTSKSVPSGDMLAISCVYCSSITNSDRRTPTIISAEITTSMANSIVIGTPAASITANTGRNSARTTDVTGGLATTTRKSTKPDFATKIVVPLIQSCFQDIADHRVKVTIGGKERAETLKQCQCLCANSRSEGRFDFQCLSANFFAEKHECVLNFENSFNRSDLYVNKHGIGQFIYTRMTCEPTITRRYFKLRQTLMGLICDQDDAGNGLVIHPRTTLDSNRFNLVTKSTIIDRKHNYATNPGRPSSTTKRPHSVALRSGMNSDECFLEFPDYVLEGMALALETDLPLQTCKCYCMDAEKRYGGTCQSIQYYYSTKMCLLNKENRISHPDWFSMITSGNVPHSYFDFRCLTDGVAMGFYIDTECSEFDINVPIASRGRDDYSNSLATSKAVNFQSKVDRTPSTLEFVDELNVNTSDAESTRMKTAVTSKSNVIVTAVPVAISSSQIPSVGPCRYSAIYETLFRGRKPIGDPVSVYSVEQCLALCTHQYCRSANLVDYHKVLKNCQLFRDAMVDYRSSTVLVYDGGSVYFDGIHCATE